jgi:hypothetical protein
MYLSLTSSLENPKALLNILNILKRISVFVFIQYATQICIFTIDIYDLYTLYLRSVLPCIIKYMHYSDMFYQES